jgi:AcrR family transcriptional regulator
MADQTAGSIRARVRAEMADEIKNVARRHLAADGANLSLRAVARDMGLVSSALYRYYPSRDELLTGLILDAYNELGEAAEQADAEVRDRSDYIGRWSAVCRAVRRWALDTPHEYALVYGSPVPGYLAPVDTVEPASRPIRQLATILSEANAYGALAAGRSMTIPSPLRSELERAAEVVGVPVEPSAVARTMVAWTCLFGAVSFELFGRFDNTIVELDDWFELQITMMVGFLGLTNG